jgi:hypothetical protein
MRVADYWPEYCMAVFWKLSQMRWHGTSTGQLTSHWARL